MLSFFATTLLLSASSSLGALASPGHADIAARAPHGNAGPTPALFARQATATVSSAVSATATAIATTSRLPTGSASRSSGAPTGSVPMSPLASLAAIGIATTVEAAVPALPTFTAGSIPPVRGAPGLPSIVNLNPAQYPALDIHAPADSSTVRQWISQINLAGAPNIPINGLNGCQNTTFNAAAVANASAAGTCWWTCGGCTRATDITFCPEKNTWGLSYDDGPSPYTPRLLNFLSTYNIKTTFFIVGSRALSRPQMLQTEYMQGHQLSAHTWSHPALTTLSNEQIVAELGWTKKIIKDITGVTPNTMRPPYGDIDDRVRYISLQMGLTPIIWTAYQANTFDTRDWQITAGVVNATGVYMNFERFLTTAITTLPNGFVVLAHDLYQQSVDLAVNYVLPSVLNAGTLKLQPIISCLGMDLAQAYVETSSNATIITQATATLVGASGVGFVPGVAATSVTAPAPSPSGSAGASSPLPAGQSTAATPAGTSVNRPASGGQKQAVGSVLALVAGAIGYVLA